MLPWFVARTFSICALDPKTGEAGVAVASRATAVGALVPYAEPGVGAIATQAVVGPMYGTKGLEFLRKGVNAVEALRRLTHEDVTITAADPKIIEYYKTEQMTEEGVDFSCDSQNNQIIWFTRRFRQVGMVDRNGDAAVHNGAHLWTEQGSHVGKGYCCQGNCLGSKAVIPDMAAAFERARSQSKTMLMSLLDALKAGESAGGDKRGKQAAAVLVVREKGHWSGTDRFCDVRVDEDPNPVDKLINIARKFEAV